MKLTRTGMWLPDGDTFFENRGDYEIHDYRRAMSYPQQKRVAVDVGAHCGYWSKRLVNDFQMVYAFEPEPDHFACLNKNTESALNILTHNTCVGAIPGTVYMEKHIANSGMTRVVDVPTDTQIGVVRLDDVLCDETECDFMKIDVEGFEHAVLQGAEEFIKRNKPVIFCEILSRHYSQSSVPAFLNQLGYSCVERIAENYVFVSQA